MTTHETQPVEAAPRRKPLWRRLLKWTMRICAVLVVIAVVVWSIWNYTATRDLRSQIDAIRAAGEPVTFKQLDARRGAVAEADNAARFYKAAADVVIKNYQADYSKEPSTLGYELTQSASSIDPALLAECRRSIERDRVALDLLDRGSALKGCTYAPGLEYGIAFAIPNLGAMRQVARAANLRTRVLAIDGQGDKAVDSLISTLRLARMFEAEPVLIHHLVKSAILSLALSDVPIVLEYGRPSPEALLRLQQALEEAEKSITLKDVWLAERVYCIKIAQRIISDEPMADGEDNMAPMGEQWPNNLLGQPFLRSMIAGELRMHAAFMAAAQKPWPEVIAATSAVQTSASSGAFGMGTGMLAPSMSRAIVLTGNDIALLRAGRMAVEIERFRLAHRGKLPETVDELLAKDKALCPTDPFTGQPMLYRKTAAEYRVVSLGEDKKENPDKEVNGKNQGDCDWGIRVRLNPPTSQPASASSPEPR